MTIMDSESREQLASTGEPMDAERTELLSTLAERRFFLRHTTRDLTDEQAQARTTVSELTIGGLIKHVTQGEQKWVDFIVEGTSAQELPADGDFSQWTDGFRMLPGETLTGLLAEYEAV